LPCICEGELLDALLEAHPAPTADHVEDEDRGDGNEPEEGRALIALELPESVERAW
jgi:hypothetical protein